MLVIGHEEVCKLLDGHDELVLDTVRDTYQLHAHGGTVVPHSLFLRFPHHPRDRIIALPAYVRGEHEVAGIKWIASFPGNVEAGMSRASALVVLNSPRTGRPEVVLEGSEISARRTGASAALAARLLTRPEQRRSVTLIGCGKINGEVLRYLRLTLPGVERAVLYDIDSARTRSFAAHCAQIWPGLAVETSASLEPALAASPLVSVATTASRPYLTLESCRPSAVVLHLSLRDLTKEAVLASHNVVDDADHVCREQTSLHRAEQVVGHRDFIGHTIGDLLDPRHEPTAAGDPRHTVFSPFGLGALDVALAGVVADQAARSGLGIELSGFLP
ncbi:MAG: 2,3-diaminopropionate biosynthesis protein SbnB [Micromonosporaceae bacterium]